MQKKNAKSAKPSILIVEAICADQLCNEVKMAMLLTGDKTMIKKGADILKINVCVWVCEYI